MNEGENGREVREGNGGGYKGANGALKEAERADTGEGVDIIDINANKNRGRCEMMKSSIGATMACEASGSEEERGVLEAEKSGVGVTLGSEPAMVRCDAEYHVVRRRS
jgi:hypothetical protein